jgi:hypothetical protein
MMIGLRNLIVMKKVFILSALAVIILAFVSISSQIIRSARVNPAECLKYDS